MDKIIGQCSLCGGNVTVPTAWWSTEPPVPHCKKCGAHEKNQLPIIEMELVKSLKEKKEGLAKIKSDYGSPSSKINKVNT